MNTINRSIAVDRLPINPPLKWPGSKRKLINQMRPYFLESFNTYRESFVGSGSVWLSIAPSRAVIADANPELVNFYQVIDRNAPELIAELKDNPKHWVYEKERFLAIRELDRDPDFPSFSPIFRAARFLYLNSTCYNGLSRYNGQGQFNAPFGKYKNPDFIKSDRIQALSDYLAKADIVFRTGDYRETLKDTESGDFVYLDPPYDGTFTGYTSGKFGKEQQRELKQEVDRLTAIGAKVLLSNSDTEFVRTLYADYSIATITRPSNSINSKGGDRGPVNEVLIRNY